MARKRQKRSKKHHKHLGAYSGSPVRRHRKRHKARGVFGADFGGGQKISVNALLKFYQDNAEGIALAGAGGVAAGAVNGAFVYGQVAGATDAKTGKPTGYHIGEQRNPLLGAALGGGTGARARYWATSSGRKRRRWSRKPRRTA